MSFKQNAVKQAKYMVTSFNKLVNFCGNFTNLNQPAMLDYSMICIGGNLIWQLGILAKLGFSNCLTVGLTEYYLIKCDKVSFSVPNLEVAHTKKILSSPTL